jgi:hypothetical protein
MIISGLHRIFEKDLNKNRYNQKSIVNIRILRFVMYSKETENFRYFSLRYFNEVAVADSNFELKYRPVTSWKYPHKKLDQFLNGEFGYCSREQKLGRNGEVHRR